MQMIHEELSEAGTRTQHPAFVERRRSRRNLHFMSQLLRREDGSFGRRMAEDNLYDKEHLKTFRGVMLAVGLSVPLWATIIVVLDYIF
jgi:hypothetical protein